MDDAGRTDTAREELRINSDVGAGVHDDSARRQNPPQELPLCTISVNLESAIKQPVDWKDVLVGFISNTAKNRTRRH
jgi:hypothetical protein